MNRATSQDSGPADFQGRTQGGVAGIPGVRKVPPATELAVVPEHVPSMSVPQRRWNEGRGLSSPHAVQDHINNGSEVSPAEEDGGLQTGVTQGTAALRKSHTLKSLSIGQKVSQKQDR